MRKIIFLMCMLLCLLQTQAQTNIVAAEYFFDNDPGAGLGTPLDVGVPGGRVNFAASIPTTSLSSGFHTLSIRTKDAAGAWGLFESRGVYVSRTATDIANITRAEFFIDNDPGPGNGTQIDVGVAGNTVQFTFVFPTTSLATGFHTLAVRARSGQDTWGLFETRVFYITGASNDAPQIVAAEYFIDNDPGTGNGTSMNIGSAGNTVSFAAAIPTTSLAPGFHTLAIRTKNADGIWGFFQTSVFYINTMSANMGIITEAEYFLDSDPGVGNGTPLTFTTPGNATTQTYMITVPTGMSQGQHTLAIRAKDANGQWGLFEVSEFEVRGFALPLTWTAFTGKRVNAKVNLQWKTENEVNTSHFVVERSKNGVDFNAIGRVTATGLDKNTYVFDDVQPFDGLNYYRLQQVDKDGASKYSIIVKVYFGYVQGSELKLFPNPVRSDVNVVLEGFGKTLFVEVYDAGGKVVMSERRQNISTLTINTVKLTQGMYYLVVSDGVKKQTAQFVKQ